MTSILAVDQVSKYFGGVRANENISLNVQQGSIVGLIGPNGSGKTTLLQVLIGAQNPTEGTVDREPGTRVGYVPQRLAIDRTLPMTVIRFLALSGTRNVRSIRLMIEKVGIPDRETRQMTDLSGGEFQRVLLAQALLNEPDILVLDEPTQALDQPAEAAFYRLIEQVRQDVGCAVLMVSHDLHVVMRASDRVICLNGHVCCEGSPTVVSAAPEYRALFGLGTEGALALYRHEHDHVHHAEH